MRSRRRLVAAAGLAVAVAGVAGLFAFRGSGSTAAASAGAVPTWKDVAPIFASKCAGCHTLGGIAPFSLTSARSAAQHAQAIREMTRAGLMPPWPPDSSAFLGSAKRILTPAEKETIARWVDGGAKIGAGGTIRAVRTRSAAPGRDVTLTPARPYLPRATGGGLDDYHCFLLEPHLKHDVFVTSSQILPGHADIVHHVILFEAAGENAQMARSLNAESSGRGWTCFGGPGLADAHPSAASAAGDRLGAPQWISAWVPGHTSTDAPKGTGVLVHAGAAVVMQVHYNLIHPAAVDRSRAVLRVVPAAGSKLTPLDTMLVAAPVELPCPAGVRSPACSREFAVDQEAKKYGQAAAVIPFGLLYLCGKTLADYPTSVGAGFDIQTSCDRAVRRPIRIYGIGGHMHLRGIDIKVELNPGTAQARTLLHIPRWRFHWQDVYYLRRPVDAGPGDTIRVTCHFNNSVAGQPFIGAKQLTPRYVLWGEGSTDEMCLGLLEVADR
jgi:mono/diheme cytochrome c family protein